MTKLDASYNRKATSVRIGGGTSAFQLWKIYSKHGIKYWPLLCCSNFSQLFRGGREIAFEIGMQPFLGNRLADMGLLPRGEVKHLHVMQH